ncbi:MAG: formimidoylglutamate deiminase [Albidovulum sp.]|nr:formimidoylglutamate deiminase [Albidovulum sp.]
MIVIWARQALLENGWAKNVRVEVDRQGRIKTVDVGAAPCGHEVEILLPSPSNLHSHAFQRAMAGLTEKRGASGEDDFWSWRDLMYRFLSLLSPEQVEAIAGLAQMEMLEAGFCCCVEFHYLHHAPGGAEFTDLAEMSNRIAAAAIRTGIGLTLLPALYQYGGCDRRPLDYAQARFGNDRERFLRLREKAEASVAKVSADSGTGIAFHSLRAVEPGSIEYVAREVADGPIHIHAAEQQAEVEEVAGAYGARPVEWILANADIDKRWCLIHCTQMEPCETKALAESGAVAGLCPVTEANLGDGIFDGANYFAYAGSFGLGTDSNVRISLAEEMRMLEYSQRLRDRSRLLIAEEGKSVGRCLFAAALSGGALAAGRNSGRIAQGAWADLFSLCAEGVELAGRAADEILDAFVFSGGDRRIGDVWSAGRHMVRNGRHIGRDGIVSNYRRTLEKLESEL